MEKLIKIQSTIQTIEEMTLTNSEYYSVFNYVNEKTLEIECYCKSHAIKWFSIFERIQNGWLDIENSKITIHIY